MKKTLNDWILRCGASLRKFIQIGGLRFSGALILGILLPYLFLNLLVTVKLPAEEKAVAHRRDTVFVKLLNGPVAGVGAAQQEQLPLQQQEELVQPTRSPDTNQRPATASAQLKPPLAKPVELDTARPPVPASNGKLWTILATLLAFPLLWGIRDALIKLPPHYNKEKDPEGLKQLLVDFSGQISSLGTPRKIKRFSNKLRFQYYILTKKNVVTADNDVLFMRMLLHIEKTDLIPRISEDKVLDPYKEFRDEIETFFVLNKGSRLVSELYVLNRGNLI